MTNASVLLRVCRCPQEAAALDLPQWELLIRQARSAELLAHVHALLKRQGLLHQVPPAPLLHLESARVHARAQRRVVRWELHCLVQALRPLGIPVLALKGAAYLLAGLPNSPGRLFHDVDILVPRAALPEVERVLVQHGWMSTHLDRYDQRYYRTWMHELPPMRHIRRRTVLDVHHNILPDTACLHPDPRLLLRAAYPPDPQRPELQVLAPLDMVLHSATHLFHDGELERGLRDLTDLDLLLRHFGGRDGFWEELPERAARLDLLRPLFYALRYCRRMLGTPIPDDTLQACRSAAPPAPRLRLMDALFTRALEVDHPTHRQAGEGLARWLLYVRGHYLRMPLYLLIPHLLRKALRRGEGFE